MTARGRTFSQAPQAVRSARGRRWDGVFPASASANGTLQTDKGDAFGLTVQVHRLRNISSTAAVRAVVRSHSYSPSVLLALSTTEAQVGLLIVLRYESRTRICSDKRKAGRLQSRRRRGALPFSEHEEFSGKARSPGYTILELPHLVPRRGL